MKGELCLICLHCTAGERLSLIQGTSCSDLCEQALLDKFKNCAGDYHNFMGDGNVRAVADGVGREREQLARQRRLHHRLPAARVGAAVAVSRGSGRACARHASAAAAEARTPCCVLDDQTPACSTCCTPVSLTTQLRAHPCTSWYRHPRVLFVASHLAHFSQRPE